MDNDDSPKRGSYIPPSWTSIDQQDGQGSRRDGNIDWPQNDDCVQDNNHRSQDHNASLPADIDDDNDKSSLGSRMTEVTDYEEMDRIYRNSSICTEVVEERGLKDPLGFYVVLGVVMLGGTTRGITFSTLYLFVESLGGDTVTMGYCISAYSLGRVITSPLLGHLSVAVSYRSTLMIAGVFMLLGAVLYSQARTTGMLILAQCMLGIGSGTLAVTRSYVAECTPRGLRTMYFARLEAVRHAGFTLTPLIGSALVWFFESRVVQWGPVVINLYTAPAYVMMVACVANLLVLGLLLKHERRETQPRLTRMVSSRVKETIHVPPDVAVAREKTVCGLSVVDSVLIFTVILNTVSKGCPVTFETLGLKLAKETFHIEPTTLGITLGCCGAVGVLILLSFKAISKCIPDIEKIYIGLLLNAVGIMCLTDYGGAEQMGFSRFVMGFFCVFAVGFPLSDTAIVGLFSKVAGNKPQGTLQGLLAASSALSRMCFPLLGSYMTQYLSMSSFFVAFSTVLLSSAVIVIWKRGLLRILSPQ